MPNILITGSSTGIGLATALYFARKGHAVYASLRNPESAQQLKSAVAAENLPVTLIRMDVDQDDSVREAVAEVLSRAGRIDVLVNNAGIGALGPIELVPDVTIRALFETNFFGAIRVIRAVAPGMRKCCSGVIVNVTSVADRCVAAAHGYYSASKYALEAACEALAMEMLPFNVRVAIVEPGVILTPIFGKGVFDPTKYEPYAKPLSRLLRFFEHRLQSPGTPEQVAEVIERAAFEPEPKLRYLVGEDAAVLAAARAKATDEEWVKLGGTEDDEAYFDASRALYGVDYYR